MSFKRGINSEEIQLSNDVFTVLEHPYKKLASDADKTKKKESIYEAHFRAGLVMKRTIKHFCTSAKATDAAVT